MFELIELPFAVSNSQHRLLGKQVEVKFSEDFVLRLTLAEASSLSFALVAVRDGVSEEREIYMSPIASDATFVGLVLDSGISISAPKGPLELGRTNVGLLAEALSNAID